MVRRARCTYPGCTRYAAAGFERCSAHKGALPPGHDETEFGQRLADGTYAELVGVRLSQQIQEAAAEVGLGNELGALRVVLANLLASESDPVTLASSVTKLVGGIVQVTRAQRLLDDAVAESLTDAIATIFEEFQP